LLRIHAVPRRGKKELPGKGEEGKGEGIGERFEKRLAFRRINIPSFRNSNEIEEKGQRPASLLRNSRQPFRWRRAENGRVLERRGGGEKREE